MASDGPAQRWPCQWCSVTSHIGGLERTEHLGFSSQVSVAERVPRPGALPLTANLTAKPVDDSQSQWTSVERLPALTCTDGLR
jgi:hypothetical protein